MYNTKQEIEKVFKALNTLLESVDIKVEIFDFSFFLPIHSNSVKDKFNLEILVYGKKDKVNFYLNALKEVNETVDWQRFKLHDNKEFHTFKSYESNDFIVSESSNYSFENYDIKNVSAAAETSDVLVEQIVDVSNELFRYGKSLVVLSREWSSTQVNAYVLFSGDVNIVDREIKDKILQVLRDFVINEIIHIGEKNNNYLSAYKRQVSAYKHSVKSEFVKLKNSIDLLEFHTKNQKFESFENKINLLQNRVLVLDGLLSYTYNYESDRGIFNKYSNLYDVLIFFKELFNSEKEINIIDSESFGQKFSLVKSKEWEKSVFLLIWNLMSNAIKNSSGNEIKIEILYNSGSMDKLMLSFENSISEHNDFCVLTYLKNEDIDYVKAEHGGLKIVKEILSEGLIYLIDSETKYFKIKDTSFIKISLML